MFRLQDKVKIPTIQTIVPCNASRCNAVIAAKMNYNDHLVITGIRHDERGTIITATGVCNQYYAGSDFMESDLELY